MLFFIYKQYAMCNMLKTYSFCSGAGGLDIGLQRTCDTDIVLRCENDSAIQETIRHHHPNSILKDDIMQVSKEYMCQYISDSDVVMCVGGIPCPSFSTAGKRKSFDDPRGACLTKFLNLSIEAGAKYIILENVRGLLSASLKHRPLKMRNSPLQKDEMPGTVMKSIVTLLEEYNYSVTYQLVDAKYVGAATSRDRVILMAILDEPCLGLIQPTHGAEETPFRTLGDAIYKLENMQGHVHSQFPSKRLPYFAKLKEGQNWRHLPADEQEEAMGPGTYAATGGKSGVFRRLSYNKPCPTLTCSPIMHTTALCHPTKLRPLSVQEYAAIQGFDESYEIKGSVAKQYRQLGNAVPVSLGEAIGRVIQAHRDGHPPNRTFHKMSRYNQRPYFTK
jgi:DNA (cytosine-5)-methyltransferase 1